MKLDNYECEGQMNLFDLIPKGQYEEKAKEEVIYKVPWQSYSVGTRYDGPDDLVLQHGKYYQGYHEVTHEKDGYRISFVVKIPCKTKTGKDTYFGLGKFYRSLPHLMHHWYLPELMDWVGKQVEDICKRHGVSGISSPYCTEYPGYLCNSHSRDTWEGREKYNCKNRPGCCKFCDCFGKCGHDCKARCETDQTYRLFQPYQLTERN